MIAPGWRSRRLAAPAAALALLMAGCGEQAAAPAPDSAARLLVSPQNSELLVGVQRVSFALFDAEQRPVSGATATLELSRGGTTLGTRPLEDIGPEYGGIPVYVGTARFASPGPISLRVRAVLPSGRSLAGATVGVVTDHAQALPVGHAVPPLRQPVMGDPGVTLAQLDSGVPPDPWHTTTIAQGLAEHRPMLLYFGQPGFCKSRTCGPTVAVLRQLCEQFCDRLLFEHIEVHFPAGPDETAKVNPAFSALGLQTDPWIFFVTRDGVVSDRFEGPVTAGELEAAAAGTLAGRVPAVGISAP